MARTILTGWLIACAFIANAQVVELPSEVRGLERKVAQSWQLDHPVISGIASGLVFGLWPKAFGDDARTSEAIPHVMNQGLGLAAFEYTREAAYRIFVRWRAVGALSAVAMILLVLVFVVRRRLSRA